MKYYQEEMLNSLAVGCRLKWNGYKSEVDYFEIIEILEDSGDDKVFEVEVLGKSRCKSIWSLKVMKKYIHLYRKV